MRARVLGVGCWALVGLVLCAACTADPYDQAMRRVRALSNSQNVRLLPFGKSHGGRSIPAFVISDFTTRSDTKARVLVCAGQHGDEGAPVESLLGLCGRLASGAKPELLAKAIIVVVPIANPDGFARGRRLNGQGLDINRDWCSLQTQEARFIDGVVRAWRPHVVIDAHEWLEPTNVTGNEIEVPACARGGQEQVMTGVAKLMEQRSGLAIVQCSTRANPNLMHRRYSALGHATFLLETAASVSQRAKERAYASAILTSVAAVSSEECQRLVMSPKSKSFCLSMVAPYLEPLPVEPPPVPTGFPVVLVLAVGYCLILWVMKPPTRAEDRTWSRRFRVCSIEGEADSDSLSSRHAPHPITQKSRMNRRLRARYAQASRIA